MEATKNRISDLTGNIREYIETRIDILKLDAADSGATAASSMVSWVIITILGLFTLFLVTVGGAIGIGYLVHNVMAGFFILAGVYLLIGIIVYFNRDSWIKKPLLNAIVKNIYEND
jgi:hypothetical protein